MRTVECRAGYSRVRIGREHADLINVMFPDDGAGVTMEIVRAPRKTGAANKPANCHPVRQDELPRKARQADTASHINEWAAPGPRRRHRRIGYLDRKVETPTLSPRLPTNDGLVH
jgi:hypothetical protein